MLRRIIALITVGFVAAMAADSSEKKLTQIQKTLDNILAKAGISFGGEFKSQYFMSKVGGEGADSTKRSTETNEFTSVDFDVKARPNQMVGAHAIFRLYQNWQNFFSDISNPIFSRWISIDANVKDMIKFNVGDFKLKYSPLTIWAPEIEIMNEPTIFARQRQMAMDEFFLGDNNRIFQGVNFGFDAEIAPIFDEFHFGLTGVRLRSTDISSKDGDYSALDGLETFEYAKYFTSANLDLVFLKGINLGGSWIYTFDTKGSANGNTFALNSQHTNVVSIRPAVNIDKLLNSENLKLGVNAEIAISSDDSVYVNPDNTADTIHAPVSGAALNVGADFGLKAGENFNISVNPAIISNAKDFRNDLAQSPYFYGDRIMNTDNDSMTTKPVYEVGSTTKIARIDTTFCPNLYSTYDALYHSVFKFVPNVGTNRWVKAPMMKTSYSRNILTRKEREAMSAYEDPSLQLVMPYGPATPNRKGFIGDLQLGLLKDFIVLNGDVKILSEIDNDTAKYNQGTSFSQIAIGAKIDPSHIVTALKYPLELSGSFSASSASNDGGKLPGFNITSNMLNLGLYAKFYKRAALLGGLQMITNEASLTGITTTSSLTETQWSAGLEWKLTEGSELVGTVGKAMLDYEGTHSGVVPAAISELNLKDIDTWLVDLSLRVKF